MSTKGELIRESKSSNQESFENLNQMNEKNQQNKSRPSESSDFDTMHDPKTEQISSDEHVNQRQSQVSQQLQNLQKMLISNEKTIQQQLQILKGQYKERQKQITKLAGENNELRKKCNELQENLKYYKEQNEKIRKTYKQQQKVSSSTHKLSQIYQEQLQNRTSQENKGFSQNKQQVDPFKKKSSLSSSKLSGMFEQDLREKLKQSEYKIYSLRTKLEYYNEQDKKIRQFLNKCLKFNPSFTMQLSTMVQSAIIQLDSNLKQINREVQDLIINSHLSNSNKIMSKRQSQQEQKYNHWEMLSNIDVIKTYIRQIYKSK